MFTPYMSKEKKLHDSKSKYIFEGFVKVGDLPPNFDVRELHNLFSKYGKISKIHIKKGGDVTVSSRASSKFQLQILSEVLEHLTQDSKLITTANVKRFFGLK